MRQGILKDIFFASDDGRNDRQRMQIMSKLHFRDHPHEQIQD